MKITYVVREHSYAGGTDRVLSRKANYLVEHGFDISIISSEASSVVPFFNFDSRIKFYYLDTPDKEENKTLYLERLTNCLRENVTDISISTGLGLSAYLHEVNDGSRKILEFHFSKYKGKSFLAKWDKYYAGRILSSIYTKERTAVANSYDRFIVLTNEDKELWRGVKNIEVIPNPITICPLNFTSATEKRVVAVGRLSSQKGFDRLIKIWTYVRDTYPDWRLAIFGNGRKKAMLEKMINKNNLRDVVQIFPATKDIETELLNSSIFTMTSRYEGQPLVLIEAMSMGLPAVVYGFKCGARETVTDGEDGFVVDEGNVKEFVSKLFLLMEDEKLREKMGEAARLNILRFEEKYIMPKWISLFDSLMSK